MFEEFKKFAVKGNMVDMAVGIIIGAAFGGIISSLVADVLMPPIGMLLGGVDFSNKFVTLKGGQFETLAAAEVEAFKGLLELSDNDLWDLVSGRLAPGTGAQGRVVELLRRS